MKCCDVYVLVAAARCGFKMVLWPIAAATRGFTMVSFTEPVSRRSTFVGGTCAPPSVILVRSVVIVYRICFKAKLCAWFVVRSRIA